MGRLRRKFRDDRGITLMEMLVGIGVMMVVVTIATTAMVVMFQSATKSEAVASTATEINVAYMRLDTSIRYANYVSDVNVDADGHPAVRYRSLNPETMLPVCYELRVTDRSLEQRHWPEADPSSKTDWLPLARQLTDNPAAPPMEVDHAADIGVDSVGTVLSLHLRVKQGDDDRGAVSAAEGRFVALNAGPGAPTSGECGG